MANYKRSFTPGDKKVSTANQVIDFIVVKDGKDINYDASYLVFETFSTACHIKINDEDTIHWIDADSRIVFSDIIVEKFTIIDAGVEYYYTAFSEK
ncbi:hypothetical protein AB3N02_22625 [Priestia aryabhattai]|uniref:hypothetical protein n=1 Tax=Priestia aryabhattai TaxID=412384 RepID=UPI0039A112FB